MNVLTDEDAKEIHRVLCATVGADYLTIAKAASDFTIKKLAAGVSVEPHEYVWNPDGTFNIGQERCLSSNTGPCHGWEIYPIYSDDELNTAIAAARVQALEEAAKVCDRTASDYKGMFAEDESLYIAATDCAKEIRALIGEKT